MDESRLFVFGFVGGWVGGWVCVCVQILFHFQLILRGREEGGSEEEREGGGLK